MASSYHSVAGGSLFGLDASPSLDEDRITLTAKPHPFAGAVLSPKHARELTPSGCLQIATALAEQSHRKTVVPYTLWITEAWRVLGWAEPSAALFWEMATMYHALYLAARAFAADYQDGANIPPILSCGSASSVGSGNNSLDRPVSIDKKKFSTAGSAKELPVWLIGTFLLLHCEDMAYQRNLSGQDESRFYGGTSTGSSMDPAMLKNGGKMDFTSLFKHTALSPRTRLHAGWSNDNTHCIAYLLRHLRKILLLTGVSHNPEAVRAIMLLAAIPLAAPVPPSDRSGRRTIRTKYSAEELRRQHDEEHSTVGLNVRLSLDDLERLQLILQPPSGGGIDDPPLRLGEFLWSSLYQSPPPPTASIPIIDVETEIRRHLELDLVMSGFDQDDKEDVSTDDEDSTASALARLSLSGNSDKSVNSEGERAKQPEQNQYQKELAYIRLRGTTILLKPAVAEASSGASTASGEPNFVHGMSSGRLHDLTLSECSDAHFYLLQPFEQVTIAACTGCTIVVGAVAGLLHVVDCERTTVTAAARRILVSNSCDAQLNVFSPSPPLLVGDNRNCQFAPYNTYYDGLREDLLATGLAAAVVPENQSPYHGGRASNEFETAWPPLQCASNKWKQPVELSKLEVPQVAGAPAMPPSPISGTNSSPGADDKAMGKSGSGNDTTMLTPILVPASEFNILFVPLENDVSRQRRADNDDSEGHGEGSSSLESQYCRLLAEVLQLSPFRLPVEYERRVLMKAERMRNIQQAVQKNLNPEQQRRFEEELNRGFRDWLVTSGNLRQVLDLVHIDKRTSV